MSRLQFTFGPVQGFVAQARTTRDFWAGSYLLSYLSGSALAAALATANSGNDVTTGSHVDTGGDRADGAGAGKVRLRLVIPSDDDHLLRVLTGRATADEVRMASELGTLPNRFRIDADASGIVDEAQDEAEVHAQAQARPQAQTQARPRTQVEAEVEALQRAAQAAAAGLQQAWRKIADTVFDEFVRVGGLGRPGGQDESTSSSPLARQWQRQVERQWEISWVISDNPSALDLRKNWRVFDPLEDPGVRCSQCGQRSALSDTGGGSYGQTAQFWRKLAKRFTHAHGYQFREGERLCAICTIKRLYPVLPQALGHNLQPRRHYDSTPTIAATDFVDEVLRRAATDAKVRAAWEQVQQLAEEAGVFCGAEKEDGRPYGYDGNLYFIDELRSQGRPQPDGSGADESLPGEAADLQLADVLPLKNESLRFDLVKAVYKLKQAMGHGPRPVFALLVMDGDHMGALLSRPDVDPAEVSKAVSHFSARVCGLLEQHRGRPIYVGGDDVLALLPAENALKVVREIRQQYIECFQQLNSRLDGHVATISAGIVYADMREPLRDVIVAGHQTLDKIAKDWTGRDAFAVLVMKHSGSQAVLSKKWVDEAGQIDWVDEVLELAKDIRTGEISTRLLYGLRNLFGVLTPEGLLPSQMVQEGQIEQFIASEYLRNRQLPWPEGTTTETKRARALEEAHRLLSLALVRPSGSSTGSTVTWQVNLDGLIVARFLADKERVV